MSVVKVTAEMNDTEYDVQNTSGDNYSVSLAAENDTDEVFLTAEDDYGNVSTQSVDVEVLGEWYPPKTDWESTDYFNAKDYNRIINNIKYLKSLGSILFNDYTEILDMGKEKDYSSMLYAREINVIEDNLEKLNLSSYQFDIGNKTEYQANGSTPLYSEFNRIESAILLLYKTMTAHKNALARLSFTLGGQKGIRV